MSSINVLSSGLDVQTIVDGLISIESAPITRMQSQTSTLQSKISAFQGLNTRLSTLLSKVDSLLYNGDTPPLSVPGTFEDRFSGSVFAATKATSSDETVLKATASAGATSGSYSVSVLGLAKAQTDVADGVLDKTASIGDVGKLDISVGGAAAVSVDINSGNNTLQGIRDAINAANAGVTASIVNDGSATPYRLVITANKSGLSNGFTLTKTNWQGTALNFTNKVAAADAHINLGGIDIYRSSNTISDVIEGTTLELRNLSAAAVSVSVAPNLDSMASAIKDVVSSYNDVNSAISSQSRYNATTKTAGILAGDSTLRDIQSKLQSIVTQMVSNGHTSYSVLSQVGIKFNSDGSLTFDETKFRDAANSNLTSVAALFLGDGAITDGRVTYNGQTSATQAGTYGVQVTGLATQASVVGTKQVGTLGSDEILTINYGAAQTSVNLLSGNSLSDVVGLINSAFSSAGIGASAVDDGNGHLKILTTAYGSSQTLSVTSNLLLADSPTGFGSDAPASNTGIDIAGTINGHAAVGSGLTLTGSSGLGYPEEGLSLSIAQTLTGSYGSVTASSGSTNPDGTSPIVNLHSSLKNITNPLTGPIHNSTDSLNQSIRALNDRISDYQDRLELRRAYLTAEYSKADQALRLLTVNQTSLSSQTSSLSSLK